MVARGTITIDRRKVALLLAERKWTWFELAYRMKVQPCSITKAMNRTRISPRTLGRMAEALGVPPGAILKDQGSNV